MKTISKFILCVYLISAGALFAQNKHFVTSGTIEFEKTCNMFALMKMKLTKQHMAQNKPWHDKYLKEEPQFVKYFSSLSFGNNTSIFTPVPLAKPIFDYYEQPIVSQPNIVFSDFNQGNSTIQKEYKEITLLVKDSLRNMKWKITDETRIIAGYNCRRANGLILDSVYVVAFYTDEIHISSGPESFNGLPGMILGAVLPHDHVSWFATKVTEAPADVKKLVPPKKGTPVDNKGLYRQLFRGLGQAGELGRAYIKGYSI
jgi:GLPGLI family protein